MLVRQLRSVSNNFVCKFHDNHNEVYGYFIEMYDNYIYWYGYFPELTAKISFYNNTVNQLFLDHGSKWSIIVITDEHFTLKNNNPSLYNDIYSLYGHARVF